MERGKGVVAGRLDVDSESTSAHLPGEMLDLDPSDLTAETLARAAVIIAVGILLFFSAVLSITVFTVNSALHDVVSLYLMSLSFADLLCALFIVPVSMYSCLVPGWNFMGDNSLLCKGYAYLQIVLFVSTLYTFAWIGVDRYAALMKPSKYETEQTLTRCKCWIAFSWLTATLLCCPVVVASMQVGYHPESELCVLKWWATKAYSITLAVLVFLPSVSTIAFTYYSVLVAMYRTHRLEDNQRMLLETDHNFVLVFFVFFCFVLSWLPALTLNLIPDNLIDPADSGTLNFVLIWLAIGGRSLGTLIYPVNLLEEAALGPVSFPFRTEQTMFPASPLSTMLRLRPMRLLLAVLASFLLLLAPKALVTQNMAAPLAARVVYVTVPSLEVAKNISRSLVQGRFAACVNIVPGVTSIYVWENKVEESSELLLIIKTRKELIDSLQNEVKKLHPYDVNEFISLPIEEGSEPYMKWLQEQTQPQAPQ
ncbi:hypothetical protein QR680_017427 [Steinernema hermaphroditum]|uniref:G-protein coupled receptors family 1 profile domain-containing protein n=1 Tax=Steinernema hermaphroditum TaxID=289476 RepID=A0AA39LP40_9BILA|nr:hypothetical protein QR680_017427 [Steinernema hermaphroditum]